MRILLSILFLILFIFYFPHSVLASTIKLNEFYSAGSTSSNPDWVEIYYSGVDITLYKLIDAAGNTKNLSEGSYDGHFCTVDWSNRLNNDGDTIKIALVISPDSTVDQVTYGKSGDISAPNSGQSAGRNPDGTGNWTIFSIPSKGSSNNTSPIATPTPTSTPTPSPSRSPISTSTPKPSPTPIPTPQITPSPVSSTPSPQSTTSQQKTSAYQILAARAKQNHEATVAAVATASSSMIPASSPIIKVIDTGQINIIKIAGAVFLFVGITIMIFIFIKSNIKSKVL